MRLAATLLVLAAVPLERRDLEEYMVQADDYGLSAVECVAGIACAVTNACVAPRGALSSDIELPFALKHYTLRHSDSVAKGMGVLAQTDDIALVHAFVRMYAEWDEHVQPVNISVLDPPSFLVALLGDTPTRGQCFKRLLIVSPLLHDTMALSARHPALLENLRLLMLRNAGIASLPQNEHIVIDHAFTESLKWQSKHHTAGPTLAHVAAAGTLTAETWIPGLEYVLRTDASVHATNESICIPVRRARRVCSIAAHSIIPE